MENKNITNVDFNQFYDELDNLKDEQCFEVIVYFKDTNDQWIENKRTESCGTYFTVDGDLYSTCGNTLLAMNMNFKNETCGACYQIGKQIPNNRKITGNEILFTCKSKLESGDSLILHKQSYSNNTCFYTLKKQGVASRNVIFSGNTIEQLINSVNRYLQIETEAYKHDAENFGYNKIVLEVRQQIIAWYEDVLNNLKCCA